jgi:hypothetical protein
MTCVGETILIPSVCHFYSESKVIAVSVLTKQVSGRSKRSLTTRRLFMNQKDEFFKTSSERFRLKETNCWNLNSRI